MRRSSSILCGDGTREYIEGFTQHEVEESQRACEAQAMLWHPTDHNFLGMVCGGMISNCSVTVNDVTNSHQIFGPDLAGIRGQLMWRPPESVTTDYVQTPCAILERHNLATSAVDIKFVNGGSTSRGFNLVSAKIFMPSCTAKQLAAGITR